MRFYKLFIFVCASVFSSFLAQADEPRLSFAFTDWKPATYIDDTGKASGVIIDILQEAIENRLNLKLDYHQRPWKRAQAEVKAGTHDFLVTIPNEERLEYATQGSIPIFSINMVLYTQADHPKLAQIQTIKTVDDIIALNLTAVTNLGNGWHKYNIENKGVKTLEVTADKNLATVLAANRADIMVDSQFSMDRILHSEGLSRKIVNTGVTFGTIDLYLLMSNKSKMISRLPDINSVIAGMKADGTLDAISSN